MDAKQVETLFEQALQITDPQARLKYLRDACAGNSELLHTILTLVSAHEQANRFLEAPATALLGSGKSDSGFPTEPPIVSDEAPTLNVQAGVSYRLSDAGAVVLPRWVGKYQILEVLGVGGTAIVVRGIDRRLGREVALKIFLEPPESPDASTARYLQEAQLAAQLDHPAIIPIYDVGQRGGWCYIAMPYVRGGTLAQCLIQSPLEPQEAAELIRAAAEALQYAHDRGVLHGDIKPGNILLEKDASEPTQKLRPRIADFGLAEPLDPDATVFLERPLFGTPSFMAPELVAGHAETPDVRSDIYSLGATLYACLTGNAPFRGATVLETLHQVAHKDPVAPRELNPRIPRDLELICLKCLAKNPDDRYQSMQELADDLTRFLLGRPVHAKPAALPTRIAKWLRRNRLPSIIALGVLFALLACIGFLCYSLGRLRLAKNAELQALRSAYLAQARLLVGSGKMGQKHDALNAIRQAAQIRPSLELRNLAVRSMAQPDASVPRIWTGILGAGRPVTCAPDGGVFAVVTPRDEIQVRRLANGALVRQLPGRWPRVHHMKLSSDGNLLAVRHGQPPRLAIWRAADAPRLLFETPIASRGTAYCFGSDGVVYWACDDGHLHSRSLHRRETDLLATLKKDVIDLQPCATDSLLLLADQNGTRLQVFDPVRRESIASVRLPDSAHRVSRSYDGRLIAAGTRSGDIYVWRYDGSLQFQHSIRGHSKPVAVSFAGNGYLLFSRSWDGTSGLWDAYTGRQHLRFGFEVFSGPSESPYWQLSRQGNRLGLLRVDQSDVFYSIAGHPSRPVSEWWDVEFLHGGELLACAAESGVLICAPPEFSPIATIPLSSVWNIRSLPSTGELLTSSASGLQVWSPVRQKGNRVDVGTPKTLMPPPRYPRHFDATDGLIAVVENWEEITLLVQRQSGYLARRVGRHTKADQIAISSDGRHIVTGTWQGHGVKLWKLQDGKPAGSHDLWPEAYSARAGFGPDGTVWAATGQQYRIWDLRTHRLLRQLPRDGGSFPAPLAFMPGKQELVIAHKRKQIRIVTRDGEELVTLQSPNPGDIRDLAVSSDSQYLAVATDHSVQIWHLANLHRHLSELGLDW